MKAFVLRIHPLLILLGILTGIACNHKGEESPGSQIDLVQAKKIIDASNKQFSEDFKNGDSVALAGYYSKNATLGSIRGRENLISAWSRMIQSAVQDSTPFVRYTINSLSTDGEYLAELGTYEYLDKSNQIKAKGKYLVVRKQENGEWKIYRDIPL